MKKNCRAVNTVSPVVGERRCGCDGGRCLAVAVMVWIRTVIDHAATPCRGLQVAVDRFVFRDASAGPGIVGCGRLGVFDLIIDD